MKATRESTGLLHTLKTSEFTSAKDLQTLLKNPSGQAGGGKHWAGKLHKEQKGHGWHYSGWKRDPCARVPQPLSLTPGAVRPLFAEHLISPLNLRLTRSFNSRGWPLRLQPSSTNGLRGKRTEGLGLWGGLCCVVSLSLAPSLSTPAGLLTPSCGADRLFTSPLIKINGPSPV